MKSISTKTDSRPTEHTEAAAKSSVARLSLLAAAFLIALKTAAGLMTGSISVWASLLDSTMDIFASIVNFFAVRAAARPADEDHSYGHGKAESLAGLFQALVITASGLFLIWEAVGRIMHPPEIKSELIGILTMLIAVAVSVGLVARLRAVAQTTESPALTSDAVHYASDVYTNGGALVALLVTGLSGWRIVDPLISISISLYILWTALSVGRDAIDILMDRKLPTEIDEKVTEIVARHSDEGVYGFHNLRTRRSGSHKFIDLDLEISGDKTLHEAHELTVKVLREIEQEVPRAQVHIHTDPV